MAAQISVPGVITNSLGNICILFQAVSFALVPIVNRTAIGEGLRVDITNISASSPSPLSTSQDDTRYNRSNNASVLYSDLPRGWDQFCTKTQMFVDWDFLTLTPTEVANMVQISCNLHSDSISFIDFREWSEHQIGTKLALNVVCDSSEGSFYLPHPMKAKNLVVIKVRRCRLDGYYSEYFSANTLNIPDEIRVMELHSTISMLNPLDLERLINGLGDTGLSIDVECDPLTLEKVVRINCSDELDYDYFDEEYSDLGGSWSATDSPDPDTTLAVIDWDETVDQFWSIFRSSNVKCNYRDMRYLVESHEGYISDGVYLRVLLENSLYPKLQYFGLSHNGFLVIPKELEEWRSDFPALDYLDLSHNNISQINIWDRGLTEDGIGRINLQYNNITTVLASDIRALKSLQSAVVDISNNPINCSCGVIKELYEFQANEIRGEYEYFRDLVCHSPVSRFGKKIRDLTPEDIICPIELPQVHIVLIVTLSAVVVVLGITVIVLLRYRREVVILVYTRLHIILPCQPVDSYEGKNYDAFISYSSKDDEWVIRTLVQRLENKEEGEGFKLCVHHRDFEIGAAIADNVVQSVESSRHTVMVLSRNYVESEWCLYEFRTAMHQSLIEKRKHLIVIVLEDVPKCELDADLRKCLETFTYIQVGDTLFWDKLLYSLARKSSVKNCSTSSQTSAESVGILESGGNKPSSQDIHISKVSVV